MDWIAKEMVEYKLVNFGLNRNSNGQLIEHGKIIAGARLEKIDSQTLYNLNDMLGVIDVEICDEETYKEEYLNDTH